MSHDLLVQMAYLQLPQENWKTMLLDNFGGATKSIMVFLSMAYSSTFNGRISYHVKNEKNLLAG